MGASASIQNLGSGANDTRVTEAFDLPNVSQTPNFSASDSSGDNDGFIEPGESISLNIPLTNATGNTITGVNVQVVGGGSANYGTMANGQTIAQNISFTVPAATVCGTTLNITINVTDSVGNTNFVRQIFVGAPGSTVGSQNFDAAAAPAMPAGWTALPVQGGTNFITSTAGADSAPNAAYARDPSSVGGGTDLSSPILYVTSAAATVTFRHSFNTETGWDGGVLEISIGGGPFQDILTAGGSFSAGGYTSALGGGSTNNPLSGRSAWNGNSGGFITTTAQLPSNANGKLVQLKWRFGADDNTTGTGANPGWFVDNISLSGAGFITTFSCSLVNAPATKSRADFDGDGRTDPSVFRPSDGNWYIAASTAGISGINWGASTDIPVPGDYDNDNKTDEAVYRPSTGEWFVINSTTFTATVSTWGTSTDKPVPADYDGDHKTDIAIYRPSSGTWFIVNSSTGQAVGINWGLATDLPVPADYDADGKTDVAVYRPSDGTWYGIYSTGGGFGINWGTATDKPVPADYDGDNKDDVAIYRPSEGNWYVIRSSNQQGDIVGWGAATDIPVPGDYDGDSKDDIGVFRPSTGQWFILQSTSGAMVNTWGASSDKPIPASYIP
jgi:hypothetical protein